MADAIATQRKKNTVLLEDFRRIVESQGRVKRLKRRIQDIFRIFRATRWLIQSCQDPNVLLLTEEFDDFIHNWNSGNHLLPMSKGLRNYPPYSKFLDCLRQETQIAIPRREDKQGLALRLKRQYDINTVAFDTFRTWAVSVGHAFLSPLDRTLYWGGDWDEEQPTLERFKKSCLESYCLSDKTSGFANLGHVAHLVCVDLRISFQAFEIRMNQFVEKSPGEFRLAPATMRRELSGYFKITSIRPRREIDKERLEAKLRGDDPPQIQWLEHRFLEDGVRIKGELIKLIRWEASDVAEK
ncbi:MAG: hypothetical protein OXL39_09455 [Caldilineaceae bacterium]|nr:hypothetical protein [Caldilineaceae bacterium]